MRTGVLLAGLLLATGASAAPADPAEIGGIMRQLGMDGLAGDATGGLIAQVPDLQALDGAGKACASAQVSALMAAQFQQSVVDSMGADGDRLIADWKRFMATEAGAGMARTFQATAAAMAGGPAMETGLDEAGKAEIAAFMGTSAFQRFMDGFGDDNVLPEDIGQRLAESLQRECGIELDPGQIS
ncbi:MULTISPECIES: hypothetical protein [Stenotrophomonas]|uniref:DUF2059 domain-containing protein n=2 Tax=Stenotrophomonas nitritireducens TaxID=83617 RepID=A0ABR5NHG3_9GAMM|nr:MULTISPECIES: hypothetical protein [Stenotrophomonas]KQN94603.1 hypothetical protein ASF01_17055 [Stenotrophomonas sp. Leaf70]KRG55362.1 hypothetical protein ABB22_14490 [Stenotrophomonas nitritireducens]